MQTNNKLREALELCDKIMSDVVVGTRDISPLDAFDEMGGIIDKALTEPPRNCDVGTAEEQEERFKNFCLSYYESCNVDGECWKCPLFKTKTSCLIEWGQMPYEEIK